MTREMINVSNLTKEFNGFRIIDNISFFVEEGKTFVLLGKSGSGKTTTLKMINRLIEPTSGSIRIDKKDISCEDPVVLRRKIGYVIQNIGLFPHYTVEQNIRVVPDLLNWDKKRINDRINELLELVDLPPREFLHRYPHEISGGQKQRVGLARALAVDPPVVLLDEPFGALDPITRRQIQKEFKKMVSLIKKTMILVTHDVFEAFELSDVICLMDEGKIQQIGTPKELIFFPANNFVRLFFESNRFQLELKVLTLSDILPFISKKTGPENNAVEFSLYENLLYVLEEIGKLSSQNTIRIIGGKNNVLLYASVNDLIYAFYKAKTGIFQ